ncbi:Mu transposase C-terminal domain-containing protein [Mycolicibacterium farcinogenes]|uniref:Mu transposase C-terminal domain-containing protein n=1 Tax=Mycolicibacterium farcinogenes TaxID=1802 RepID=A0ACD1FH92_MYCFR|nr:Mu transposase C-terminal domain-containing protein [Mycolicibacterium farcinogenes]QZH66425.1 Mu transposase C-terminal domain-containing protein [Mycolicibacterium farcinogenes]
MNHRLRIGPGVRLTFQGELLEIIEIRTTSFGNVVTVKPVGTTQIRAIALREILMYHSEHAHDELHEVATSDGPEDVAATVLAMLNQAERRKLRERADHIREVLTGCPAAAASSDDIGAAKPEYDPSLPLTARYEAKAAELGVDVRTVQRMVAAFREHGEAGLVRGKGVRVKTLPSVDERWREIAIEVMVEHTDQSRPSRTAVIRRTNARVTARYGADVVPIPSRATAFRVLTELESKHPTFRLSTKRNRDIAERNPGVYGKLRPTRPGEYMLMDTTRLDVFAMDPVTLRWSQVELTVSMDWYTRCITGLRLTPVSTKSSDVAAVLFQAYRPLSAPATWPKEATWPEHGIPRSVLVDTNAIDRETARVTGPTIVPETLIVDHGKAYGADHTTSVCQRMGISIQPARLRTGRDKGPVERFFRTLREDLLQYLPGYKGPDIHSRGADPEADAHFYLNELEEIIREWIAVVYHRRPHAGLVDPALPGLDLSPVTMFEHGLARAGYIEAPRHGNLAYEFLGVEKRTIQHYGIEIGGRRYNGAGLDPYRNEKSPYRGGLWPVHYHPDDVSRVYFRDPADHRWHTLMWEHAGALDAPFSEDALGYARKLARQKYTYPNDELALELLLERWNLGLGTSSAERRMALRLSRQDELLCATGTTDSQAISTLPSVQRALSTESNDEDDEADPAPTSECGDDDDADGPEDFYASAWEDA